MMDHGYVLPSAVPSQKYAPPDDVFINVDGDEDGEELVMPPLKKEEEEELGGAEGEGRLHPSNSTLRSPSLFSQSSAGQSSKGAFDSPLQAENGRGTTSGDDVIEPASDSEVDEFEEGEGNVPSGSRGKRGGAAAGSRKEKSLGLLCQRFLAAMKAETAGAPSNSVHLETVAQKMKVEKRRIYDIVNVMEALDAMSKMNKSYYAWHGLGHLPRLMHQLQREAIDENLPSRILRVEQAMCSFVDLSPGARRKDLVGTLVDSACPSASSSSSPYTTGSPVTSPFLASSRILPPTVPATSSPSTSSGRDAAATRLAVDPRANTRNSLAMLCRRFIMVLLANPQDKRRVSLDVASTVLIKDPETEGFDPPSRGRCRRLYDIANVLVAMGIIKKVHYLFGTKKIPLFIYSGPEPDENGLLSEERLEEMLLVPRRHMNECIRERTTASLSKRSKSEASLSDAALNKQGAASKISRIKSEASPSTSAAENMMMELANAAERDRLVRERLSFVIPLSPSGRRRAMAESEAGNSSGGFAGNAGLAAGGLLWPLRPPSSSCSIPTSPLAAANTTFVLPRLNPWTAIGFRSSSSGGATVLVQRPSPRQNSSQIVTPTPQRQLQTMQSSFSSQSTASALSENASPSSAVRRVLAPLQMTATSPRGAPPPVPKQRTPKYSIKRILGVRSSPVQKPPPAPSILDRFAVSAESADENTAPASSSGLNFGLLEHRGSSLFRVVKREQLDAGDQSLPAKRSPPNADSQPLSPFGLSLFHVKR